MAMGPTLQTVPSVLTPRLDTWVAPMLPVSVMRGQRWALACVESALAATTSRAAAWMSGRCASTSAGTAFTPNSAG